MIIGRSGTGHGDLFLTQPDVLAEHFGKNFDPSVLPKGPDLEKVSKTKVVDALDKASRHCAGGPYKASPFAKRFFEFLRQQCA